MAWMSDALERLLTYESGLLGVSGISSDMRMLLEKENRPTLALQRRSSCSYIAFRAS